MIGVLPTFPFNGDLLALLNDFLDFLTDLLLDFLDFVFFLMSFPFDLLRLLLFSLFFPLFFLPLDTERSFRNFVSKTDLAFLSTELNLCEMRFEHFLASSFTRLWVLAVRECPRFMTDLDRDLVCERNIFLFRDLDLRGPLAAGGLSKSLKPFVYLKMFLLTLLMRLLDRLRPRELTPEAPDRRDLADLADFCLLTDLLFDFDFDLYLPLLLLNLRFFKLRFFLLDFRIEPFLELLLRLLRADRLPLRFFELLLLFDFRAEPEFTLLPDPEWWRGFDLCLRISYISAIYSFIRKFLRLRSVDSMRSVAIFSKFYENLRTRLLNCETSLPLPLPWPLSS